jgi:glycosyltransferase involved in cell wall biosynthesis
MSLNIWYLNAYAAPPEYGRGERPLCIAQELSEHGHQTTIVAASRHHLQFGDIASLPVGETFERGGRQFWLVPTRPYQGNGLGRILNMRDYAREVGRLDRAVAERRLARPDVMIVSSPHPLAFAPVAKLARRWSARIVFEERDLWPLSLVELSGLSPWHPICLWMQRHVRRAYQQADAVVTLLPNANRYLESQGAKPDAIHYIPNGVSLARWDELQAPLPVEARTLFDNLRYREKLIVVYAGAHGKPNALDQILLLADVSRGPRPYHFVLIGEGTEKELLQRQARERGLDYISFLPPMPKTAIPAALAVADVGFMPLADSPLFAYGVSPNKLFDYFMAGLPVIYAVNSSNRPVEEAEAGYSVNPYDAVKLDRVLKLMNSFTPEQRRAMGERGRQYVRKRHEWTALGAKYAELCETLVEPATIRRSWRRAA